jgi:1-acyl-sn-glycerol-3-phosphate acyltransferase
MHHAKPRLKFIPQRFNPLVLKLAHGLLPLVLRFRTRPWLRGSICRIETENVEILVKLYQQFQAGKIRFLMAFHHPEVEDPLCMLYLMSRTIPRVARERGISLQYPIHSHFIYDRGMTIWAGDWLGWLFSRGGGIPIHRGKPLDRLALKAVRDLLVNGKFPMTVAPEGANNGHGEIVSPLEPGVAQLAFWCLEDLAKANRTEEVLIVPIGIRYHYLKPPWSQLDRLLSQLEADSGLPPQRLERSHLSEPEKFLYPRLLKLGEHLLMEMEAFYRRFYHQTIPDLTFDSSLSPNQVLATRLQSLLDVALKVAEDYFGLPTQGTIIDRCRRLEQVGWNAIYREDIPDLHCISPLQRGLADWIAEEAELHLKHMRLVESFVAVTGSYVKEKPSPERFAETTLILFDLMARIKGKKIPRRPRLGKRRVSLKVGEPILINERWQTYQRNRKAAKQAIAELTRDLQTALENLVKSYQT